MEPRQLLRDMFDAAVAAGAPERCVPAHLPEPPARRGRTVVVGAGKASAAMAKAVEDHWRGGELSGVVVTRYGHAVPCRSIGIVEAAHPVPDEAGVRAAERIVEAVSGLGEDDLVLCLISGGGSALLSLPAEGLDLKDRQEVGTALTKAGASIFEINAVRKHISRIKGGRLAAAAAPARVVTLIMSDVPGDDPAVIASGPTVPDPSTFEDAHRVLEKYGIDEPRAVVEHLRAGRGGETPKPDDPTFECVENVLVSKAQDILEAAAEVARRAGVTPVILSDSIEGESREVGKVHAAIARQIRRHGQPARTPAVLLSGGETTVTVKGEGRGGPNAEFALGLAIALRGLEGVYGIAGDTDGIDGTEDNAGALVAPDTLARAEGRSIDAEDRLAANDAYGFFEAIGDLVCTGPTLTNVNDFRAVLVLDGGREPRRG